MNTNDPNWHSWVQAPIVVGDPDATEWADAADVVVVGLGGAGATAALQAAEVGACVIAVERFGGGGATALSGGIIYAGGTPYQREAGFEDDTENLYSYLKKELHDAVSDQTIRRFSESSAADVEWLTRQGVQYKGIATLLKTSYPPRGYYLYFSGNERLKEFEEVARPVPRGHRAFEEGNTETYAGGVFFRPLMKSVLASGVKLIKHASVGQLVIDRKGEVIGVVAKVIEGEQNIAEHEALVAKFKAMRPSTPANARALLRIRQFEEKVGQDRLIRARGGVILAAGGFVNNPKLLKHCAPTDYGKAVPLGTAGCDGSGIRLGQSVGGATSKMHRTLAGCRIAPPSKYIQGILVGANGERMMSEEAYSGTLGREITERFNGTAWLIINGGIVRETIRESLFDHKGLFFAYYLPTLLNLVFGTKRGRNAQELARKCGMNPAILAETVRAYNGYARGDQEDPFGKPAKYLRDLGDGPLVAVNMAIGNRFALAPLFTLGGLAVDEESGGVLTNDGRPVPGLFAAGRTAVGIPSESYVSGLSIADCVFSGRRAGSHAANRAGSRR